MQNENISAGNRMDTDHIGKLMLKLALPAITAQLINVLYNIVDRIFIGRMPNEGADAIAGLGVAFPILLLISAFAGLIGMGGAPLAAIKLGEKDNDGAERILGGATVLIILFSLALTSVFLVFKEQFLLMFGASETILPYADSYITIYLIGTVFVLLALGLNTFISAQGFAMTSMLTVLIGAVINIILDPILIYGFDLGVKGAALATIIAQGVSAVWVFFFLLGKKTYLKIRFRYLRLSGKIVGPILALGISPFIMQSTECLVQLTFNAGMQKYGGDSYVSAMAILFSVMQIFTLPLAGLVQGAQPIVSYNFGAKRYDRVKKSFLLLLKVSLIFSACAWAVCLLFPGMFAKMFTTDRQIIELSTKGLRIFFAGFIFLGAQFACQQTLVGLGQAKVSLCLALLRKVILLVPLALILGPILETFGILLAEPVSDTIASICTTIVFAVYVKKMMKKLLEGKNTGDCIPSES